jgi:anion-transporting  ArsA/GET3 family ATPase
MSSILDRRLIFVSGKGGVGKTTVALGLGLWAVGQGLRCLLVEIDTNGTIPARFGRKPAPLGEALELRPRLDSMIIEGRAALDEYLGLILPKVVLRPIFGSKIYEYFVAGAPGLKELMCIGKIFYEEDRTEDGQPRWDLIVVDAPATGHGLELYRMPQAAHETFSVGLVHRETERVLKLLRDPGRTTHVLVTLAEELPVSETLELYRALRNELRFPLGPIVVNRFHPEALPGSLARQLQDFRASLPEEQGSDDLLQELLEKAELFQATHDENMRQLERLHRVLGGHVAVLPALFEASLSPESLAPIVEALGEQLAGAVLQDALGAGRRPGEAAR